MFLMTGKKTDIPPVCKRGRTWGTAGWPRPGTTKEKSLIGAVSKHIRDKVTESRQHG